MTASRLGDYLEHIAKAIEQVATHIEGLDRVHFLNDKRTQQAVVLNLVVIGEAATRVIQEYSATVDRYPDIPWRSMRGMRNRIAHGYFEIDLDVVWVTIQTSLPALKQRLNQVIVDHAQEQGLRPPD